VSFPSYPAYKDSGFEWLGEVPEHWNRTSLKFLADYQNGYPFKPDDRGEDGLPIIRISQLTGDDEPAYYSGHLDERVKVRSGDLLFSWSASIDSYIWSKGDAWLNQHIFRVSPSAEVNKKYLYYVIKHVAPKLADFDAHGSTMRHIKKESLGEKIYTPSVFEQGLIAAFLDHETTKIDALIAEQQRLIELLQEKRQAVISHAVTKGLNPDVPMKDSGVEWLGEVPEHWKVKPLKHLMTLTSGGTPSKENYAYWDGTIPWASSKDLKVDELLDTQDHISRKALDDGAAALVPVGSILTVVRGMILLHTFPVVVTLVPMAINQDLKAITPSNGIASGYLAWLLRGASHEVLARVDEAGHGTKVLRMDSWLAMQVPVPPAFEQELIVAELVKRLREIVALTDQAHKAVCLLQERRSALISAAVTGQIDVRGYSLEAAVA
jgi:type I restriction enzyme S subunit